MKNSRRWPALLLAVALVGSNAAYSLSTSLHANEDVSQEVWEATNNVGQGADAGIEALQEASVPVLEDSGQAMVTEILPESVPAPEEPAQDTVIQTAEPEQADQGSGVQEPDQQPDGQTEVPGETQPNEEGADQAGQEVPVEPQVVEYQVMVEAAGGNGTVSVREPSYAEIRTGQNINITVNSQNPVVRFEAVPDDGFEVLEARINGNLIYPQVNGNISLYEVYNISSDSGIKVTFTAKPVQEVQEPEPEEKEPVQEKEPEAEKKEPAAEEEKAPVVEGEKEPSADEEKEDDAEKETEQDTEEESRTDTEDEDESKADVKDETEKADQESKEDGSDDEADGQGQKADDEDADDQAEDGQEAEDEEADADEDDNQEPDVEEGEDQKTDDEKKEADLPAQILTADANGVTVIVRAPAGTLPEGTTVKAVRIFPESVRDAIEAAVDEEKKITDITAVDVTLYDKEGNEIQPEDGRSVAVTFAGVAVSGEAGEMAVYHVDDSGSSAVAVTGDKAAAENVVFYADHFSTYAVATSALKDSDAGIAAQADGRIFYLKEGETISLNGTTEGNNPTHSWTSSDPSVAKVKKSDKNGKSHEGFVTAVKKSDQDVTITHKYKSGTQEKTEIFRVRVSEGFLDPNEGFARVYVYVHADGYKDLYVNEEGWITLGYIDVPQDVLPIASEADNADQYNNEAKINRILEYGFVPYTTNKNLEFDLSAVDWTRLKVQGDGTNGYDKTGKEWHLDGEVKLETHNLSVSYECIGDELRLPENIENKELKTGEMYDVQVPDFKGYNVSIEGYSVNIVDEKMTVKMANQDITITVKYIKVDTKHEVKYTVQYYKDGKHVNEDDDQKTAMVLSGSDMLDVDWDEINTANKYEGYKFDHIIPSEHPSEVSNGTVIRVYYVTDNENQKELSYTVEYYQNGTKVTADTQKEKAKVQVLQSDMMTVERGKINIRDKYYGYKLDTQKTGEIPEQVDGTKNIVIKVYYVTDDAKQKELGYTVEYYQNGTKVTADTQEEKAKVQVLQSDVMTVERGKINIRDKYYGYKLDTQKTGEIPEQVDGTKNIVIKVYYVTDDAKQKELGYTVEYYQNGTKVTADTQEEKAKVQVLQSDVMTVERGKINIRDKYYGYKLDTQKTEEIPEQVDGTKNIVIKVYYVTDDEKQKELGYTVEYYQNGTKVTADTQEEKAKVQVLQSDMITVERGKINIRDKYYGYKLDTQKTGEIPEQVNGTKNIVIKVYYIKDADQTQPTSYTVKHVILSDDHDPELLYSQDYTGTAWVNDNPAMIAIEEGSLTPKEYNGYKFVTMSPDSGAREVGLTEVVSGTTITLSYAKDDEQTRNSGYTVKYTFNGVERTDLTKEYTAPVWVNEEDESLAVQEGSITQSKFTGYMFDSITPEIAVGDKIENGSTITLNYVSDSLTDPTEPTGPDGGDNIPDKYQITVNYAAVNGSVSFGSTVVTKRDADGGPAENGKAVLAAAHIPTATADEGYGNGKWDKEPAEGVEVTDGETLTITYEAVTPENTDTPETPDTPDAPDTPDTPTTPDGPATPDTPATPDGPAVPDGPAAPDGPATPVAPIPVALPAPIPPAVITTITNPITPLANPTIQDLTETVANVQELVDAADQDVPLANNLLEDLHICCIFHFLLMLIAMILMVCYTSNAKKRQKKIFALREELEIEKARRGIL